MDAFVGICDQLGWRTGIDFVKRIDASEDVVRPARPEECRLDRMAMMMIIDIALELRAKQDAND